MADAFKPEVQSVLLSRSHAFATKTPSDPGTPPAAIDGNLAGTMRNELAIPVGDAAFMSKSGPTERYSRIQELGGWMQGHPLMHWHEDGVEHWSAGHSLPERPYMKPVQERMVADGSLRDASAGAFRVVVGV